MLAERLVDVRNQIAFLVMKGLGVLVLVTIQYANFVDEVALRLPAVCAIKDLAPNPFLTRKPPISDLKFRGLP